MKKGIQYFSDEHIKRCKGATPDQIIEALEDFRELISSTRTKDELLEYVKSLHVWKDDAKSKDSPTSN
jgi:hypothetical protein